MTDMPVSGASRTAGSGSVLLTISGLAAAFGVASCCGLPFLLATMGLSAGWLTGFALLAAPHRAALLAVGAVCLGAGALLLWRQHRTVVCVPGAFCSRPAVKGFTLVGLMIGVFMLYLGYRYA